MKIVTNCCYGGFGLSEEAMLLFAKKKGFVLYPEHHDHSLFTSYWTASKGTEGATHFNDNSISRNDLALIQVVEELGAKADGRSANLKITEIPDGVEWEIMEYDGLEWVAEQHRTW